MGRQLLYSGLCLGPDAAIAPSDCEWVVLTSGPGFAVHSWSGYPHVVHPKPPEASVCPKLSTCYGDELNVNMQE